MLVFMMFDGAVELGEHELRLMLLCCWVVRDDSDTEQAS